MGRDLLMGKSATWQWVSRDLLVTLCSPSWIHVRNTIGCCEQRQDIAKSGCFYRFSNRWSLTIFFYEIPNLCSSVCWCSKARSTLTPPCNSVGFCLLPTERKKQITKNVFIFSFVVMQWLDFRTECESCLSSSGYHIDSYSVQKERIAHTLSSKSRWNHRDTIGSLNLTNTEAIIWETLWRLTRHFSLSSEFQFSHAELHRSVADNDCNCATEVPDQSIWETKVQWKADISSIIQSVAEKNTQRGCYVAAV